VVTTILRVYLRSMRVLLIASMFSMLIFSENKAFNSGGSGFTSKRAQKAVARGRKGVDGCRTCPDGGHSIDCSGCSEGSIGDTGSLGCGRACQEGVTTLYLPRPQGLNSAALFNPFYFGCDDSISSLITVGYRYNQAFDNNRIADCLFGTNVLRFRGSKTPVHNTNDLLADNFGLAPNFFGTFILKPTIKNHIVDVTGLWRLGDYHPCLASAYFQINLSAVNSTWRLNACETHETASTETFSRFPSCYMSPQEVSAAGDIHTALSGDFLFGDMQTQWRFGRFILNDNARENTDTKLANIDFFFGYDFLCCDYYHLSAALKLGLPTGTRPDGREVFSPIIGNGHHFELGAQIDAHYDLWCCGDQSFVIYLNGCVSHLFKDTQWRTFDFKRSRRGESGVLSRYVLLKEFNENNEYTGHLINAVNYTTRSIKSSFGVQGDASLRLLYYTCGWAFGVGYNIYGRSKESITGPCTTCREFDNTRRYGIKGVTGVCAEASQDGVLLDIKRPLVATQSTVRAFNRRDIFDLVDNPVKLEDPETGTEFLAWDSPASGPNVVIAEDSLINGEPAPVLVSEKTIRFVGIPAQITHKVFGHVDYQWSECQSQPFVGLGGEAEFGHNGKCHVCTPNAWSVWVRGGFAY